MSPVGASAVGLRQPWAMGAVVALFVVLYALGTRALRKGPGGRGFTHD